MAINERNNNIAIGDKLGSIYLIDISSQRFEHSIKLDSCVTCIAFVNDLEEINLIVSTTHKNSIYCLNYSSETYCSEKIANLSSVHKTCVNYITISYNLMLSSSQYDRCCIWDLNTLSLLKQLTDLRCSQSLYLSIDRIIASYRNPDLIYVFDSDTFEVIQTLKQRQLVSAQKNSFITRNVGNNDNLEMNIINDANNLMSKTVKPIDDLDSNSIKQLFSCYNNRILIYLTIDGLLKCKYGHFDSTRFTTITISNQVMTGITSKGELHVFHLSLLNNIRLRKSVLKKPEQLIDDNQEVVRKLSLTLLTKYHKFPQKYRYFIWSKLLSIPLNRDSFKRIESQSNFHNKQLDDALRQLQEKHDIINDSLKNAFKKTISQLIYWRPKLLNDIEDLALFSFPFIKLLHQKPLVLFETLATLLNNNYFINKTHSEDSEMFKLVSTLLKRESFKLESHFNSLKVNAIHYCLPLIVSLFSEVFLRKDWLILCDHLITFGPQMFIYLVVSYCHLSKQSLLRLQSIDEINSYLRAQNSMPVNKVIQFAHQLSHKYVSLIPFNMIPLPQNVYN